MTVQRAVVFMFDTLIRSYLGPYGATHTRTPNFNRLAERTTTFDNCYAGSMPCMPARREMHTARHNFLHRSWGPLEPFDDSIPEILDQAGIYTHLATDHYHYWEDGGATYHNRFSSYELFRGQESDTWKAHVGEKVPKWTKNSSNPRHAHNWVNRQYQQKEDDHSQTQTVNAGIDFLRRNHHVADPWLLQIECFDPHEPFFSSPNYLDLFEEEHRGAHHDWPSYRRVIEGEEDSEHLRNGYRSLLAQCDHSLGRVLDEFDTLGLWEDTMLIVCTDHGFLLGERQWWGKSVAPWFNETIHTPLFLYDPRQSRHAGNRSDALVQTIDIGPTLLDAFGVSATPDMHGVSLSHILSNGGSPRASALFGNAGAHVNVTDGRFVYMRAPVSPENSPFFEYTLMPTHMFSRFRPEELRDAQLYPGFTFTKDTPVLKLPADAPARAHYFGTRLYDLRDDPRQLNPLVDEELELRMVQLLIDSLRDQDAPEEQFLRLGLPPTGPVGRDHLLARHHRHLVETSDRAPATEADYPADAPVRALTLASALADPELRDIVVSSLGKMPDQLVEFFGAHPLLAIAAMQPGIGRNEVATLNTALQEVESR